MTLSSEKFDDVVLEESKSPRLDRLKKLLEYMKKGELSVDKFDFSVIREKYACGTCGCMAGELPVVFPEHFQWIPKLNEEGYYLEEIDYPPDQYPRALSSILTKFFNISYKEVYSLFIPSITLKPSATKEQVVANLENFIKSKEKNES